MNSRWQGRSTKEQRRANKAVERYGAQPRRGSGGAFDISGRGVGGFPRIGKRGRWFFQALESFAPDFPRLGKPQRQARLPSWLARLPKPLITEVHWLIRSPEKPNLPFRFSGCLAQHPSLGKFSATGFSVAARMRRRGVRFRGVLARRGWLGSGTRYSRQGSLCGSPENRS